MKLALRQARRGFRAGEVPVGAVVVDVVTNEVLGQAHNDMERSRDPMAHAEMLAMRRARRKLARIDPTRSRLASCALYVTLEPCAMCAGAIGLARIDRLYIGAPNPEGGAVLHGARLFADAVRPDIFDGIQEEAAVSLLKCFFATLRR